MYLTRRLSQAHVNKILVIIKKFGSLDSMQDGPDAVDPTGITDNVQIHEAHMTMLKNDFIFILFRT